MIEEAYCSYEVSKLLKEKGFKEWCNYGYGIAVRHNGEDIDEDEEYELKSEGRGDEIEYIEGGHLYHMNCNNKNCLVELFACPTHQMAMRWLREEKNIYIEIRRSINTFQYGSIIMKNARVVCRIEKIHETFEEAVEEAIKYCLEDLL